MSFADYTREKIRIATKENFILYSVLGAAVATVSFCLAAALMLANYNIVKARTELPYTLNVATMAQQKAEQVLLERVRSDCEYIERDILNSAAAKGKRNERYALESGLNPRRLIDCLAEKGFRSEVRDDDWNWRTDATDLKNKHLFVEW